ncbi:LysR family transcriptional regulator [Mesorhizobium sp. M1A.F.Ca.ET.072.01.1.1]|uniref:LysR family transcriptional regulator n=1 Tax=Mesorhizobium sp. M1A.F.Ca.ET.072.01.1.1 TaxID=2496753 RepID=UPI000FD49ACD|nr:LysR family transcriptional regulator [Mesorhizobium sp. M1A.F.Ca.ET.072.01.1.1]RUW46555.1 LysR family transcriptional regulator [Mesorhizobium sp. M1A.F.Ca.ET.072.01.1.1]TIV04298.1 MAG: LysR family transcriptional regulator [Mesorhizobium sp.]
MAGIMSRRLDVDALRALVAIEKHGGVTRAAEVLGLSQSAVSHKMRRLEASLDCEILSRKPNAPLFTTAGHDLLAYARRILGIHDEAVLSLSKSTLQGKIALGMTEDTTCTDLSRILGRFRRLHPEVSVRTQVRMSLVLREQLSQGALDAAIVQLFQHEVRPADIVLYRETLHWVKSPDLVLSKEKPVPFLSFDENCFYRRWGLDLGQDEGTVFETVFECSSAAGIIAGVTSGLGVALLSQRHLQPGMEIVDKHFPKPPDLAYVIRRARNSRNPALETLVREIEAEVKRYGALQIAV